MTEPTRIVLGIVEEPFERDQEAKIITLAAAALAAVAAVGNQDQDTFMAIMRAAVDIDDTLSRDAQTKLRSIADELVASLRAGKRFVAFARFRQISEDKP